MSFKKCQVVMLPTNEKAIIHSYMYELGTRKEPMKTYQMNGNSQMSYAKHLYIISDEEIKEGDWYYSGGKSVEYSIHKCDSPRLVQICKELKSQKIIATTDNSLTKEMYSVSAGKYQEPLPQPSQAFINKYVEEYNKGNKITEVMVEYEEKPIEDLNDMYGINHERNQILKINPKDNTITIKKVKDSYTRDEVVELLHDIVENGNISIQHHIPTQVDKWIEENL